jgi:hypothetical protein
MQTVPNVRVPQTYLFLSFNRIHYSDRYSDDEYEYRHVILPKPLFKMIPKQYFSPDDTGTLRLLSEAEWRGIGITQSLGWEHYEVHGMCFARFTDENLHNLVLQRLSHMFCSSDGAKTSTKNMLSVNLNTNSTNSRPFMQMVKELVVLRV